MPKMLPIGTASNLGSIVMISRSDLKRRTDSGELTSEISLSAIKAHEKTVGAFICCTSSPRGSKEDALRGGAMPIKHIIDTSELSTEMGRRSTSSGNCARMRRHPLFLLQSSAVAPSAKAIRPQASIFQRAQTA